MAETASFELFPRLPTEIRLQIWREALSVPAVWFAIDISTIEDHCRRRQWDERPPVELVPLQSSHSISEVCIESRCLAETLRGIPPQEVPIKHGPEAWQPFKWDRRLFWTDWDTATIHMGNAANAERAVNIFCPRELALFKHISFEYDEELCVKSLTQTMKKYCTHLSTIAVFVGSSFCATYPWAPVPQTWPTAAMIRVLASIPDSSGDQIPQVPLTRFTRITWMKMLQCGVWIRDQEPVISTARYYRLQTDTASL